MSPEQVHGLDVDHRTDIYSLGVTLYEMATGQRPFDGSDAAAVVHAVLHAPIPSLKHSWPEAPDAFDQLVRRAMAKDPADRYQRMDRLARDLRRILRKQESVATGTTLAVSDVSTESIVLPPPRRPSRVRLGLISGAVSLALLALGGSLSLWGSRCLWTPSLFPACTLPAEKHVGVLPLQSLDNRETNDEFLLGLRVLLTAKVRQLARDQESLCVHNVESADAAAGVGLLVSLSTERAGDTVRLSGTLSNLDSMLPLRRFQMEADLRQVSSLQGRIARTVRGLARFEGESRSQDRHVVGRHSHSGRLRIVPPRVGPP